MSKHVMFDIEAFGNRSPAFIASIGAVEFDPFSDRLGQTFYVTLNEGGNGEMELRTVLWWLEQGDAARRALTQPEQPRIYLQSALKQIRDVYGTDIIPWANGTNYDIQHLDEAYTRVGGQRPWGFRWYCMRPLLMLAKQAGWSGNLGTNVSGVAHNALDDAVRQARVVQAIYRFMKGDSK